MALPCTPLRGLSRRELEGTLAAELRDELQLQLISEVQQIPLPSASKRGD